MNCCIAAAWSLVPGEPEVFGELAGEDDVVPPAVSVAAVVAARAPA